MFFGTFGSIFLLAQVLQSVLRYSPFQAGLRMLLWTGSRFVAPLAGILSERSARGAHGRRAGAAGRRACLVRRDPEPSLTFGPRRSPSYRPAPAWGSCSRPSANALARVGPSAAGRSGLRRHNTFREIGGVFGVSVLATVFASPGAFASPQAFVDGIGPALWVGAAVLASARRWRWMIRAGGAGRRAGGGPGRSPGRSRAGPRLSLKSQG